MNYSTKDINRFWSKVDKERSEISYNGSRCWEWTAGKTRDGGYGSAWMGLTTCRAHCVSYKLKFGKIENGLLVLHHCDNRICVNPDHLFLGTHQDNMTDKVQKGRQARGETHGAYTRPESRRKGELNGRAKLTREDVAEIRKQYGRFGKGGKTLKELASEFGVTFMLVSKIINNKLWKD